MKMDIAIGTVVVLKSGGPRMTVIEIRLAGQQSASGNGDGCPICGPVPRLDSNEASVLATMSLAQQQWRTRHDAHVDLKSGSLIQCCWIVDGKLEDAVFPMESLCDPEADDAPICCYRHRRRRRVIGRRIYGNPEHGRED